MSLWSGDKLSLRSGECGATAILVQRVAHAKPKNFFALQGPTQDRPHVPSLLSGKSRDKVEAKWSSLKRRGDLIAKRQLEPGKVFSIRHGYPSANRARNKTILPMYRIDRGKVLRS